MIGATATLAAAIATQARAKEAEAKQAGTTITSPASAVTSKTGGGRGHDAMLKTLEAYAQAHSANYGLPGMTIVVVDRQGFTGYVHTGWADIDRKVQYGPDHLCQVGSISKMMCALTVWSLFEEGKLSPEILLSQALPAITVKNGEAIRLQIGRAHV